MGLLTALSATELLRIVAGVQWLTAAPVVWFLAPLIALNTLEGGVRALVYLNDAPEKLFFRNLIIFCVTMPLMWAGVTLGGFWGVILASTVVRALTLVLTLKLAEKETNESFFAPFLRAWRSFSASAFMVLAVAIVMNWGPPTTADTTVSTAAVFLAIKCGLGILVYLSAHFILWTLSGRPSGIESFSLTLMQTAKAQVLRRAAP
jgi:O-antigen/teichoic acid export membrane protein